MVMSRAYGYYYSDQSDEFRRLVHLTKERKVGGFCLFQGDVYETALLTNMKEKEKATAHGLLAQSLVVLKKTGEAAKHRDEALKLDPDNADAKAVKLP